MSEKRINMMLPKAKGMHSLTKRIILLCLCILPLSQTALLSQVINNNGAVISVSSISVVNSQHFLISAGDLGNNGIINLSGNFTNLGSTYGNGIFSLAGHWLNTNLFSGSNTVIFNGTSNQLITRLGGETFYNLSIENSGALNDNFVSLSNDVTVSETLFMLRGIVNTTPSYKLLLSKQSPSALNYTSVTGSRVLGKFERGINLPGTYLFPLGTTSFYNPANLTMGSLAASPGKLLSEFLSSLPGNVGLPKADPPVEVDSTFIDGFWSFTSNGFSSGSYNINVDGTGFTEPVKDITRVVTRINGGPWTVDGIHQNASGMVAFRNILPGIASTSVTQFALAKANPLITLQPVSLIVCEQTSPVFKITATGTGPLTFRWFKYGDVIINSPHYTGNRTNTITINNVTLSDAGTYYCSVRDRDGNTTISQSVTLVVNKIPVATVSNSLQPNKCSGVAFDNMVLGESYGVAGTSYVWSRTSPAGLITSLAETGTAASIGDVLYGTFTNTLDVPITITFTITPVGPNFISYVGSTENIRCTGLEVHASITVNPVPKVSVIPVVSSICYDGTTSITLVSNSTMTQPNAIKFDYNITSTALPAIVSGNFVPESNVPYGSVIRNTYSNKSDIIQSVFFNITATAPGLCPSGVETPIEVKVHPLPLQHLLMPKTLTCDGGSDAILTAVLSKGTGPLYVIWDGSFDYHREYSTSANSTSVANLKGGLFSVQVTDNLGCKYNGSQIITGARLDSYLQTKTIPTSIFNTTCIESIDGELSIQETLNSTGIAPFKYKILYNGLDTVIRNTFSATNIVHTYPGLPAGNYQLFITDANGCYNTDFPSIDIVAPDTMKVVFDKKVYPGGYNITCKNKNDGSVSVESITGGNGGYTYKWYPAVGSLAVSTTTNILDSVPAGKYYLRTTDRFGCIKIDSVILTEPNGMQLVSSELSISRDGNTNISCFGGNDGYIKLNIAGGSGNNTYSWISTNGFTGSEKDIFGLRTGNYTATVTDQTGCILRLMPGSTLPSFNLTEPAQLALTSTSSVSNDGAYNINCNGGKTGWINITVSGGSTGSYKYIWSTTDGSGIVNGQKNQSSLSAGTYNVLVTDLNNCSISKSITLTQPAPVTTQLLASDITCLSPGFNNGSVISTVSGGVAPYTYLWSNGAVTKDILGLTQGFYRVTVTYNGSCTVKDSVEIKLPPPLKYTRTLADYNGYSISCNGMANGSISVTPTSGLAPFIYSWTGPSGFTSSAQNVSSLKAGQYVLSIIDKNYCSATETITLTEPGKLGMIFNLSESIAGGFNVNCNGDNTGYIGIEPLNQVKSVDYLWSDGIFGKTRMNLTAGIYSVIMTDANNCQISSAITLTEPDSIKLAFDVTQPQCPDKPDGEVRLNVTGGVRGANYSYLWSDNSTKSSISNIPGGYYKVRVTDMNACSTRDSVIVEPRNETCLIIPNAISANGDLINDEWNIKEKELYPQMEIIIFNRWGEVVWRSDKGYTRPWDGSSNGAPLPIDSYHYIIDLHNGSKPMIGNVTIVR